MLGSSSERQGGDFNTHEESQAVSGEGFRQAFVRNARAVITRRKGERVRKPTMFFDEVQTSSAAEASTIREEHAKRIGDAKRYASINVRTLAVKGDKYRKHWKKIVPPGY